MTPKGRAAIGFVGVGVYVCATAENRMPATQAVHIPLSRYETYPLGDLWVRHTLKVCTHKGFFYLQNLGDERVMLEQVQERVVRFLR
ncbi:MAG: hypothetical protein FWH20_07260 [Oscillospiraceae bacterium]|nr:hypothetical protein [Oscillospiraceae bacterium]